MPTYEQTKAGYRKLWNDSKVRSEYFKRLDAICATIVANKKRYLATEKSTGVPWFMVGALHYRESSNDFKGVLHNGEKIIGTNKQTKLVPSGRGPFISWEESAIDALMMPPHSLGQIKEWPVERILYESERFNGFGYLNKTNSPYIWSGTDEYADADDKAGKYVADGKFSASTVDTQMGVAAILKRLALREADVASRIAMPPPANVPPPPDIPAPKPNTQPAPSGLFAVLINIFKAIFGVK